MKQLLLCIVLILTCGTDIYAQWANGGTQLSFEPAYNRRVFLSATADGGYFVTWISTDTSINELSSIQLSAYDSMGVIRNGWTHGGITITNAGDYGEEHIITSEDDGVIVAWSGYQEASVNSQVFIQKYSFNGAPLWNGGNPLLLTTSTAYHYRYPIIVSDKRKGVFLATTRYNLNLDFSSPDILLLHIDSSGSTATGWADGGMLAAGASTRETYSQLAVTKDTRFVYMGYADYPDSTHLMLKKFNVADGSVANGWNTTGVTLTRGSVVNPRVNCNFWLYADSAGNATALWLDAKPPFVVYNWILYMNQVDGATGTPKLGPFGKYVTGGLQDGNGIDYLEVKQDKEYNLLVAFNNRNTVSDFGTSTVDAWKIAPNGTVLWSKTNLVTNDYSYCPKAVSDGRKGMFVFYEDVNTHNLYVIAVDSTGSIYNGWNKPGAFFGSLMNPDGFNPNYDFSAVATVTGKAIVAWDRRDADNFWQIFSCNVNSDGSVCGHNISTGIVTMQVMGEPCTIYPNPFTNYTNVFVNSESNSGMFSLELYDLAGKLVEQYLISAGAENNINTASLGYGMYFYRLVVDNGRILQQGKLVKQ